MEQNRRREEASIPKAALSQAPTRRTPEPLPAQKRTHPKPRLSPLGHHQAGGYLRGLGATLVFDPLPETTTYRAFSRWWPGFNARIYSQHLRLPASPHRERVTGRACTHNRKSWRLVRLLGKSWHKRTTIPTHPSEMFKFSCAKMGGINPHFYAFIGKTGMDQKHAKTLRKSLILLAFLIGGANRN